MSMRPSLGPRPSFAKVSEDAPCVEEVGPDSFEFVRELGKGSFGQVFEVAYVRTRERYAMKVLQKNKIQTANLLRYTLTERNVLSFIKHPYIVQLHFAFQTSSHLVLVLQYCSQGSLQTLLTQESRLEEPLTRLYAAEVLLGFCHLHEREIVYRDLKPDNIVIDEVGHALLTDFGLSKEGVSAPLGTKSFCGSIAFLAPEILQRKSHNHTVDIYGLGVLVYDMLTGMPPFYHTDRQTLFFKIRHDRLRVPSFVSQSAVSFIQQTMERDPKKRLGATCTSDLQSHAYFEPIDWAALELRQVPPPTLPEPLVLPRGSSRNKHRPSNPFTVPTDAGTTAPSSTISGWEFAAPSRDSSAQSVS